MLGSGSWFVCLMDENASPPFFHCHCRNHRYSAECPTLPPRAGSTTLPCSSKSAPFLGRVHVFPTAGVNYSRERSQSSVFAKTHCRIAFPSRRSDLQGQGREGVVKCRTLRSKGRELLPHLDSHWEDRGAHSCPGLFQSLFSASRHY